MNPMNKAVSAAHAWSSPYLPIGGAEKVYLLIEAAGKAALSSARAQLNLSLVLDRSESMSGQPLAYSKQACQFITDLMEDGDSLSMVAFDQEAVTVFPPGTTRNKAGMKRMIEAIDAGRSTNLSGGLIEGVRHVRKGLKDSTVNRVILLSDGHANAGITDREELSAIAQIYHAAGIGITTIGAGSGLEESFMEAVAESGGGNFYYIRQPDDIPAILEQELEGLLRLVARNVTLTLHPSDAVRITGIFGYRSEERLGEHTVRLGDMAAGESKQVLIELAVQPRKAGTHALLLVNCEYADITSGAAASSHYWEVTASFTADSALLGHPGDAKVLKHMELMESARKCVKNRSELRKRCAKKQRRYP
ncbi:vWA domain-containing protein [Paenibacillus spongiae]|uniref:VWA domain-containing protein n=1 Tax=Paenibacillus spongiae TaxID=2909671 RepID=A0ABY5SC21_9BACL|nr:VWA domain-containing protein [Paenibacillus spongiae]UVI31070.1 VWA domain-containing protein [Paenibacillus spongiae]